MPRSMPPCQDVGGVVNQVSVYTREAYGPRPAADSAALDSTSDNTCGPGQQSLWMQVAKHETLVAFLVWSQSVLTSYFWECPKKKMLAAHWWRCHHLDNIAHACQWRKNEEFRSLIKSVRQRTLAWWNPEYIFRTGLLHFSPSISFSLSLSLSFLSAEHCSKANKAPSG